jgi:benzoylformate decarboxylase
VGIALGKPGRKVIGLIGDGSSLYSIQGLWSAAQLGLPITFLILKNGSYAALREFAPVYGFTPKDELRGIDLPGIDFVAMARSLGCEAERVSDPLALPEVLRRTLEASHPTLVEIGVA